MFLDLTQLFLISETKMIVFFQLGLTIVVLMFVFLYRKRKGSKFLKSFFDSFDKHDFKKKIKVRVIVISDDDGYKRYFVNNINLHYSDDLILLESAYSIQRKYHSFFPIILFKEGSENLIPENFRKISFAPKMIHISSLNSINFEMYADIEFQNYNLIYPSLIFQIDLKDKNHNISMIENWLKMD